LDGRATLNLAQVSKWYNDAVWSVDGVRSMKEKMEAAKPDIPSEPLYWAARYGNMPAVRALLKSGVDVDTDLFGGFTPLHCASRHGHTPVVKALIEAGADVKKRYTYHVCSGYTVLHLAAVKGHVSVITELIKAGADVNATNEHDISHRILPWSTSLHYAVRFEHEDCVAVLLAHGADVHYADDGWINADVRYPHNPMRQAVLSKNKKIIEMLKQAGG
jgi:ankyrin repeat protein